ncbi:NAD(P)-dependent oxidoreductase [Paraburkholderia sp.]|uniref:NAD(P)-dependent oxidoreductase n=1 Tax=Paraburkholderia sp. TaxID=1926495 RepID=UPI00238FF1B4|nr:NAD(P)-dependent oxidoreductase [Paraburkholderia sp.]MDE1180525.1 NAD(P)-dependent oxidoreductase [Paraburkholderia sp.]
MTRARVGFCGLGKMGLPMAQRLVDAGYPVRVWNRSMEKANALQASAANCVACDSPANVAADADIVMLCLADAAAVEAVAFGVNGLASFARPGTTLVDHSTLAPSQTIEFAQRWHERTGGRWIDAPVSGGTAGASAGTLAIMAGGDAALIGSLGPILAAYAARVTRMGDSGAGQATKLANQTIVMTTIAALAESTRLARRAGIDATRIPAALQGGWADSVLLQTLMPRMIAPPMHASGTIRTMLKDLDAVEALAHDSGTAMPVASLVRRWLAQAVEQGLGDADISQIVSVEMS